MAVYADPRVSDREERSAEQRVDRVFERSGFGLGALALVMGFVLFAAVTEIGHPTGPSPTKIADRSIDQPPLATTIKPTPQVPISQ